MNELELQRLVDGELTFEDRRRVLSQLDQESSQWKTLALALMEDREFDRVIREVAVSSIPQEPSEITAEGVSKERVWWSGSEAFASWLRPGTPLMLAASLLLGIGFFGGNWLASRWEATGRMVVPSTGTVVSQSNSNAMESTESHRQPQSIRGPLGSFTSPVTIRRDHLPTNGRCRFSKRLPNMSE